MKILNSLCIFYFRFDFFLISQNVRYTTVSPTHYNCIENSANLKPDHVQRLAYKFSHLYYNWSVSFVSFTSLLIRMKNFPITNIFFSSFQGTVSVPAPCQYAHKLAFLTAQNLGVAHCNLDRLLYYL